MLKVNPTQREEMKVFFFSKKSNSSHTGKRREMAFAFSEFCTPSLSQHLSMRSHHLLGGGGGGGGSSYLRLGSPGDLLHTSPLCQVTGAQDGPPALAHLQAGCPWEALTLHNLTLRSCWAPARAPLTLTHSLMDSAHT